MAVFTGLGTAASPSITFSADTNSGLFSPGADQVAISTAGTSRLHISAAGSVGIGTSNPDYKLDLASADTTINTGIALRIRENATAGAGALQFTNSAATVQYGLLVFGNGVGTLQADGVSSRLVFSTDSTERMRIDSIGNVGIGTASPNTLLHVANGQIKVANAGAVNPSIIFTGSGGGASGFIIGQSFNLQNLFVYDSAAATNRLLIDSSGRVLIGTSAGVVAAAGLTPFLQLQGTGENAYATIGRWSASTDEGGIFLTKSRGAAVGTVGVVQANDGLGEIVFSGDDGTNFIRAARIEGAVDGTPGTNDMPGRLMFYTTADGSASPTERMRIDSNGFANYTGAIGRGAPVTKTSAFTVGIAENWLICNGIASITVTLPTASAWTGREIMLKTIAAFTVISASANVVPLAGGAAGTAILAATGGKYATLVSDGTNWIIMEAN